LTHNTSHESDPGKPSNSNASAPDPDDILRPTDSSLRKNARKGPDPNDAGLPQAKNQPIPPGSDGEEIEAEGLLSSLLEVMRVVQTLPFNQRGLSAKRGHHRLLQL
jgi:hypothetical protein